MKTSIALAAALACLCACQGAGALRPETPAGAQASPAPAAGVDGVTGTLRTLPQVLSKHVANRQVDVWLPPGYDRHTGRRYPVLYMHDGQNLFDPKQAYAGIDWAWRR